MKIVYFNLSLVNSQDELKAQYRTLIKKHHPDTHKDIQSAEITKEINVEWDWLKKNYKPGMKTTEPVRQKRPPPPKPPPPQEEEPPPFNGKIDKEIPFEIRVNDPTRPFWHMFMMPDEHYANGKMTDNVKIVVWLYVAEKRSYKLSGHYEFVVRKGTKIPKPYQFTLGNGIKLLINVQEIKKFY